MDVAKVITQLKNKYPDKKVIVTDPENPTEIVCEVLQAKEESLTIAVIDEIRPHYHKNLIETYKIIKGELRHFNDNKITVLKEGEEVVIKPGNVHWATGRETWLEVHSKPGWTPEDHILVFEDSEVSRKAHDKS